MKDTFAVKIWLHISKPFQITKVLEVLYMLDWIWYAVLSYIPRDYITGTLFTTMQLLFSTYQISVLFTLMAFSHMLALYKNIIWLRKSNLLFNISLLIYLTVYLSQSVPIAAGIGYYVILIGVSIFAFWRMDETH